MNDPDRILYKGLDVDQMDLQQLKDIIKMILRLTNFEHDRLTKLQERVFELECKK
jgi:hypothetical protein